MKLLFENIITSKSHKSEISVSDYRDSTVIQIKLTNPIMTLSTASDFCVDIIFLKVRPWLGYAIVINY